ncbi:MAG: DUF6132 family protein [Planctomycetota bacterium]|jgi:thioredoxin 1
MAIWLRLLIGGGIGLAGGGLLGYFGKCSSGACPLTANPLRGALFGTIMGIAFALAIGTAGCGRGDDAKVPIKEIGSEEEFTNVVLNADRPVFVDFHTENCAFCKKQAPTVQKLAGEYEGKAVFVKVNGRKLRSLVRTYEVRGYPTVLIFSGGEVVSRFAGFGNEKTEAPRYREALDAAIE